MGNRIFDPAKLDRLNNPQRLLDIPPPYIWSRLDLDAVRVMVDIGAGTGFFALEFLKLAPLARVYACDLSETMLDWISENICPEHPRIEPVLARGHAVPLPDACADLVYSINLHHELDEPLATLEEAHRLLRPGGKLFVCDWKKEDTAQGPPLAERLLPEELAAQLREAGFVGVKIDCSLSKNFLLFAEK